MSSAMCAVKIFFIYFAALVTDLCQAQVNPTAQYCEQNAVLSTNKPIYRSEDTLAASCVLPSSCYRYVDDVVFQLADNTLPIADTTIGNTTFTVTSRYSVQAGDSGKHLKCVISSQKTSADALSAKETLIVAEPPSPVENITCVVFSYLSMNCSFWPKQQQTGIPTTYNVYYQRQFIEMNFPPKNFKPCPNRKGNTCVFNGKEFHRIGYYAIFVQSRNELGNANKTSVFEVEHLVKLECISTLKVEVKGQTWFKLLWKKPYPEHILENTTYEISVHSLDDPRDAVKINITSQNTYVTYNVTDRIPYISYTVMIRSFPWIYLGTRLSPGGYWSDSATMEVTTMADVPGRAPQVTAGGFLYHRITKMLDIYWQHVPLYLIHGEPEHYRIRLFHRSANDVPSCRGDNPIMWKVDSRASSTNQTFNEHDPYDVCIDLNNQIGYNESLQLIPIRIPEKELRIPRFYARLSEDNQIEVRILEYTGANTYTLYWCKSFIISCLNKDLRWMVANGREDTLIIPTDLPVRQLMVALSAEYITEAGYVISSGMKYSTHLFKKALSPIQMPIDLKSVNSKAGSITVHWKKPNKVDTVYIDHFTVDYCLKDDCSDQTNHHQIYYDIQGDLDGTEQTVSISDLVEEKVYQLRVRSDGDGKNSSYSDPIEVMVPKSGLSKTWITVIAVVGVIALISIVSILYTVIRKCRKKVVEFNTPLSVFIPNLEEQLSEQNGELKRSDNQYTDIVDDGYERIQDGQNDKRQQVQETPQLSPDVTVGEVNHATQMEEVALLDKQSNGHVRRLCEVDNAVHCSGIS